MSLFTRIRKKWGNKAPNYVPISELSAEDMKCDMATLIKEAGLTFATIGTAVSAHYDLLDDDTCEQVLEDSLYFIKALNRVVKAAGEEHLTMAYIYALMYHLYATNNGLMTDPVWAESVMGIMSSIQINSPEGRGKSLMDGYA